MERFSAVGTPLAPSAQPAPTGGGSEPADLAVIIVSHHDERWLEPCLRTVFAHAGGVRIDVVVVDNGGGQAREVVATRFPLARVIASENRGFAHANNRAWMSCDAHYVLFLNPDTEVVDGTFAELLAELEARPDVGLAGVRQTGPDGTLFPSIRYFPSVSRAVGEALASERWPVRWRWSGERELEPSCYEREFACDWTSGSFMLVRRAALLSAGLLDERFFLYAEEPDLCLRIKRAGWSVRHLPTMTIIHHGGGERAVRPKLLAQQAFARRLYAYKHFGAIRRTAYLTAVGAGYGIRAAIAGGGERRHASRLALRTLTGRAEPPFGPSPRTAIR
jgi:GT2 family glycosyltransferase